MPTNSLLDVSQNIFTPDIVKKISVLVGQSTEKTKSALMSAVPVFISGILEKGATPEGAEGLVKLVNDHNFESVALPDENNLNEGNEVVNDIFKSRLKSAVSKLVTITGLRKSTITRMLALVAPMIMGVVGSEVKKEKLNSHGLMNYFDQQKILINGFSSEASEYYRLSGKDPEIDLKMGITKKNYWKEFILLTFLLILIWFWWQAIQLKSPAP